MSESTPIYFPSKLSFPLTIVKISVKIGDVIAKYTPVINYKYFDFEPQPLSEQNDEKTDESERKLIKVEYVGSFDCPLEGEISSINIKVGDKITDSKKVIFELIEPCTHSIQYGGLCALCGKSIEDDNYTGFNEKDRAPISMIHGTTSLKVSSKEAENIEKSSTQRLLKDEKLSLVVDLDQTVIHATVDPTVQEWMSDPTNPNYEAIKDVRSFSLEEQPILPPHYTGPKPPPSIRWYYVKLRPGLHDFLQKVSKMYELHIYTMATRSYAKSIAKIIDPDGIYFGERILSRDESGSLTQKSLKRLFPVDTSMVVVIDDRGDVWNWSPNLIKVVPYDFFVGIGDINSSFLPRRQDIIGPSKRRKSMTLLENQMTSEESLKITNAQEEAIEDTDDKDDSSLVDISFIQDDNENTNDDAVTPKNDVVLPEQAYSPVERMMELTEGEDSSELLAVQASERSSALEQQESERPLAKLQENLEKIIEEEETTSTAKGNEKREAHNLLNDDDNELEFLGQALFRIHNEFYMKVEQSEKDLPDVMDIMTGMKQLVFRDLVFLISGVFPTNINLETTDLVIWAKSFGATIVGNYEKSVTHVICRHPTTFKVKLAKTLDSNVKVVSPDWLFSCMSLWERVSEEDYTFKVDQLLSDKDVNEYLKTHEIQGIKSSFDAQDLDWGEIDEDLKEFLGSDDDEDEEYDDYDDKSDSVAQENLPADASLSSLTPLKRDRTYVSDDDTEMQNASNVDKKLKLDDEDVKNLDSDDDDDDDDFERELLEDLADLEEE